MSILLPATCQSSADTTWPIAIGIRISIVILSCSLEALLILCTCICKRRSKTTPVSATTYEILNFDQMYNDFELKNNSAYGTAR